ncbi:M43 family zinc metalloprotease [Nonlabens xiamenensis]|uniref:M43 family zinc metalloprotease n=1 Tax=Nonlabens xiamenensis TaxID=2341043 RepID=UPI000F60A57F|nr:M43 family zinc metalloprotease [Nonlabens xiamenensis]
MKKTLTSLLVLGAVLLSSMALAQRTCSAHDDLELAKSQNPTLARNMQRIEQFTQRRANELMIQKAIDGSIITIPVVVHVLYGNSTQNISDAQIQSQIDVLNEDFRRLNADRDNTWSQAADMQIEFCLAQQDPNGNPTNGITRKASNVTTWNTVENRMKSSATGGIDPWDTTQYLNMWTVSALNSNGRPGILGYAQFPGGNRATDGVVMGYNYFGRTGAVSAPFNGGRTTTHEVGHFLNLRHIWGDGPCGADDFVSDTPESDAANAGCQVGSISCGSSDMVQNYMDYSDDACMNLFTTGQKARMRATLLNGGFHSGLAQSTKCTPPSGGGNGTGCNSTIDSFPYNNGFENGLSGFTQDTSDSHDWTLRSGGTPSSSTGPSGADQGSFYVYVEASDPNFNKTAILNAPCFDFASVSSPEVSFRYQMTGNAVGTLSLQAKESTANTWSTIFTQSGDQGSAWKTASASLASLAGKVGQLRLVVNTIGSWQGDIAVDAFEVRNASTGGGGSSCTNGVSSFPYAEGFENTLGQWTQNSSDSHNWSLRSGGTPSSSTGPSGAAQGSYYIYVEASDPNFNKTAILDSPCFDLTSQSAAVLSFKYQMTGNAVGRLRVQASTGGAYATIFDVSGDQGAAWRTASVDLATYLGSDVNLRLVVNTSSSWQGDIAVDDLAISSGNIDKCAGVPAYNSNQNYSVGDRVVYQDYLFELQPAGWENLGQCGTARSISNVKVNIPNEISIYPNPVSGAELFTTASGSAATYQIFNLSGQLVRSGKVNQGTIEVSELTPNVYLIRIDDENNSLTTKFIKK